VAARTEVAGGAAGATEGLVDARGAEDLEEANPEQQLGHASSRHNTVVRLEGGEVEAREVPEVGEAKAELRRGAAGAEKG